MTNWLQSIKDKLFAKPDALDTSKPQFVRRQALSAQFSISSVRLVWLVFVSILILIFCAYFSELDVIVRGYGQVVPSQRVQHIQNLEGGIIEEILVKEGDAVNENKILARIENTLAGSQYREALERKLNHEAAIARLQALINNVEPIYSNEVQEHAELMQRHNNILAAIRKQNEAEYNVLSYQSSAVDTKLHEAIIEKQNTKAQLEIAKKQRELAANALKSNAFPELEFLAIEQNVQELTTKLDILEYSIPRLELEKKEQEERVKQYEAELLRTYNEELGEIQAELISVKELLKAGSDRVNRTELLSPVNGIVKTIYYNTIGGVVPPGETIMDIVPLDDSLIIEAKFSPADIGFLAVGQKATVRLSAYDFATYGSLEAVVESISADAIEDEQGQIYFIVKIRTKLSHLPYQDRKLPILAGMQVEADIITSKKSILDYILKPILRVGNKALREQ